MFVTYNRIIGILRVSNFSQVVKNKKSKVSIWKQRSNNLPLIRIESREDGKQIHHLNNKNSKKVKVHLLHYLIYFTTHLFNNPWAELIWPCMLMYSFSYSMQTNKLITMQIYLKSSEILCISWVCWSFLVNINYAIVRYNVFNLAF